MPSLLTPAITHLPDIFRPLAGSLWIGKKQREGLMEAKTTGKVQCTKCQAVYEPVIKVLERVCPECLSMKTVPVEQADSSTHATA